MGQMKAAFFIYFLVVLVPVSIYSLELDKLPRLLLDKNHTNVESNTNNTTVIYGQDEVEIKELMKKLFPKFSSFWSTQAKFRPPSESSMGSSFPPEPTLVEISLKNIQVESYNESSKSLSIRVGLVSEFVDKRLAYEPISERQKVFFSIPNYSSNYIWMPSLGFEDMKAHKSVFEGNILQMFIPQESKSFVTPSGRIYVEKHVVITMESSMKSPYEFSFKIIEILNSVRDVQLQWRSEFPVTFKGHTQNGTVGKFVNYNYNTSKEEFYLIRPAYEKCKKVEYFGNVIGEMEYSCLKLGLTLSKEAIE